MSWLTICSLFDRDLFRGILSPPIRCAHETPSSQSDNFLFDLPLRGRQIKNTLRLCGESNINRAKKYNINSLRQNNLAFIRVRVLSVKYGDMANHTRQVTSRAAFKSPGYLGFQLFFFVIDKFDFD